MNQLCSKIRLFLYLVLIVSCLLFSPLSWSAVSINTISNMNGLKLRLVPSNPSPVSGLGVKTVEVYKKGRGVVQVRWFSPSRIKTSDKPYPEYRIKVKRGGVQATSWPQAKSLSHPHLWIQGFVNLHRNGLLWVPSQVIQEASSRKSYVLEVGFLSPSFTYFSRGPRTLVSKIQNFRQLVQPVSEEESEKPKKKKKKKKLSATEKFVQDFSTVRVTSTSKKLPLVINGQKTDVPVIVVGNKYVDYTVLKSANNPLILDVRFKSSKAPAKLKSSLKFFQKNMGYRITQINTGG